MHWAVYENEFPVTVFLLGHTLGFFLPLTNEVWGNVMFSQVFVCPHGGGGWLPSMHHWSHNQGGSAQPPRMQTPLDADHDPRDTVNKRAVRILLECILVLKTFHCPTCTGPHPTDKFLFRLDLTVPRPPWTCSKSLNM